MLTRSQRRAISRDEARKNPVPPRPRAHGLYAELVNARRPMPRNVRPLSRPSVYGATAISGQARVNSKRNQRAAFWRTVKVHVHPDIEQAFRAHLHLLGTGARIDGRRLVDYALAVELDIHLPGAPARAVKAEPVYSGVLDDNGARYLPRLDRIVFYDVDGQVIDVEAEQVGATS